MPDRFAAFQDSAVFKATIVDRLQRLTRDGLLEPGQEFDARTPSLLVRQLLSEMWNGNEPYEALSDLLGFPEWFARVFVALFESLSSERAAGWAIQLLETIPPGADLNDLQRKFHAGLLKDPQIGVYAQCLGDTGAAAIVDNACLKIETQDLRNSEGVHLMPSADETQALIDEFRRTRGRKLPFGVATALFTVEWICGNRPVNAMFLAAACRTGRLPWYKASWERLRLRPGVLCGACPTMIGALGLAYRADRDRQMVLLAEWFSALTASVSVQQSQTYDRFDNPVTRLRYVEHETCYPSRTIPLPPESAAPSRSKKKALVAHWSLVVAGSVALFGGWSLAASLPLCLASGPECVPYDSGAGRLLSVGGIMLAARILILLGRRLSPGSGWHAVQSKPGGFVLYLRSFQDDITQGSGWTGTIFDLFLPRRTVEEEAVAALRYIGPVVAFGSPNERVRSPGASRIYVNGPTWPATAYGLIRQSRLIVMMPGFDEGVRKELSWIRQVVAPEKLLLYIPDEMWRRFVTYREDGEDRRYATFLDELLLVLLGKSLSDRCTAFNFLWFRKDWNAKPLGPGIEPLGGGTGESLADALWPVYEHFGVRPPGRLTFSKCLSVAGIIACAFYLPSSFLHSSFGMLKELLVHQ